ncbi:hypothetical protein ANCDUO_09153 [Ancylostoma duodenale]|uniref:Uncharacterized protein n=1 Tax=Ancylostoma duodenale TaxID=51022 RepID=A0A0C2GND3_9BILA|nr:hypothetical protein ANCDUO_09153 [Ancylostoma duodenale]
MELSPVLSKLFPQPPGSQTPPQIPRAQYGYPVPPALRPHAGPPQGMTLPNALSMLMLRSNHAAHVNGSLQNQQRKTSSNFEIHPLHPEIRHVVPPSNPVKSPPEEVRKKKRNQHNKSRGVQRQANASSTGGTTPATAPITPSQVFLAEFEMGVWGRRGLRNEEDIVEPPPNKCEVEEMHSSGDWILG